MIKQNCWEFKRCGREHNDRNLDGNGVCPAVKAKKVNGVHDGTNGGRCCWAVAGTLCGGQVQGIYAYKLGNCEKCEFYQKVHEEEGEGIIEPKELIHRLEHS